jgi:hypothetical protein
LPGNHGRFDRQQLAADLGPGEARDEADAVRFLGAAEAEAADAQELVEVFAAVTLTFLVSGSSSSCLTALRQIFAVSRSRLRHAGFARVVTDDVEDRRIVDRQLAVLQAVLLDLLRQQEAAPMFCFSSSV